MDFNCKITYFFSEPRSGKMCIDPKRLKSNLNPSSLHDLLKTWEFHLISPQPKLHAPLHHFHSLGTTLLTQGSNQNDDKNSFHRICLSDFDFDEFRSFFAGIHVSCQKRLNKVSKSHEIIIKM